jgi:hypothetical protein
MKSKRGGKRSVSGNIGKYKYPTVKFSARVPSNILEDVTKVVKKMCDKELLTDKERELIKKKRKDG